jgi:hypothetical protein
MNWIKIIKISNYKITKTLVKVRKKPKELKEKLLEFLSKNLLNFEKYIKVM